MQAAGARPAAGAAALLRAAGRRPYSRPRRTSRWKRVDATRSSRKPAALEAQHAQQAAPERLLAARQVAGARVGAADMGAEGAADAVRVVLVEEAVGLVLAPDRRRCRRSVSWWAAPGARRPVRRPTIASASARRCCGSPAGLLVDEVPEAAHVLVELAEHEVAAVAAEIAPVRGYPGRRQDPRPRRRRPGRAAGGRCRAVLVGVAEQYLAQAPGRCRSRAARGLRGPARSSSRSLAG